MTDIKTKAEKVFSAYYDDEAHDPAFHLTGIFREVINQLQQSPGVINLVMEPHPTDKQYCIDNDKDWVEPGQVINNDVMLHDLYYSKEI